MALLSEKIKSLKDEIGSCSDVPDSVRIVAVTKNVEHGMINDALAAGITEIGENRVQEAKKKMNAVGACFKHFIGHMQRNKVRDAVKLFDSIDSVDSYPLADLINVEAERLLKKMPVLVQVNIADDKAKHGLAPEEVPHFVSKISVLKWLDVQGLMAIIPFFDDSEEGRVYFRKMKNLFDALARVYSGFSRLSMGMTNDFKVALEEGANEIRIGSYLFK
jgi:pyridoxal phosphate enzyme (YggS family)